MSGFALIFDQQAPISSQDKTFAEFLDTVAVFKQLDKPEEVAIGPNCLAAKLDSDSSLHRGLNVDPKTGSWLLAVGTVIDTVAPRADGDLIQLLTDYLEQGNEIFQRLDGHFALVIYDNRNKSLVAVTDPFGLISFYYGQKGSRTYISTSALAVAKVIQAPPDDVGTRSFILYGSNFGETTLWQGVKQIFPGSCLQLDGQGLKRTAYWSFEMDRSTHNLGLLESVEYMIELIAQTLRRGLAREGKVWLSLTGGFDSRTLATMLHYANLPFKSYCHGPLDSKDVQIASRISQTMGWDHEYFPLPENWGQERLSWLDRTLTHTDARLGVLKTSRIIREQTIKAKQYPVSLWGYGGEIYRGFYWKQEFFKVGTTSKVDYERLLDFRIISTDWPILKDIVAWKGDLRASLKTHLQSIGEQNPDWPNTVKLDLIGDHLERSLSGATISAVLGLQRALSPFDFKDNMVGVLSVNHKWRRHSRLFRLILERLNPELAALDTADGGPASTMRLNNIPKFVPYWLRVSEKFLWGATRNLFGRSMWRKINPGTEGKFYPILRWRQETLAYLAEESLLVPPRMYSAYLYDQKSLENLLAQAQTDGFKHTSLLSRIVTLEMAMRLVGTTF